MTARQGAAAGRAAMSAPNTRGATAGTSGARAASAGTSVVPKIDDSDIDETGEGNPAGLPPLEAAKLLAGGPVGDTRWLYPYDGTVFPGGTVAPLVMWTGGGAADAVYLHMRAQNFAYKGLLKPSIEGALFIPSRTKLAEATNLVSFGTMQQPNNQLAIPQYVWNAAQRHTLGGRDPFSLELTVRANGQIRGPISAHIVIARGAVQGSIYYNSCLTGTPTTTANQAPEGLGAIVMRIPPGGNAEIVSEGAQCVGCHAVSAFGTRLVAQRAFSTGDTADRVMTLGQGVYTYALSLPLLPTGKPDAGAAARIGAMGSFGALYPDGSKYLAASGVLDVGYRTYATELQPPAAAALLDAVSGMAVPDTGIPADAAMPMFSPDGQSLVFNAAATNNGRALIAMQYDVTQHKARDPKVLVQNDVTSTLRPGWPSFLPDSRAVVFVQTDSANFTSRLTASVGTAVTLSAGNASSDLYIAGLAGGKPTLLANAMGINDPDVAAKSGPTYLPGGTGDLHRNHFPTVSPVPAGGYFWVFFDSVRNFGSMGTMRALWGAAIDIRPDGDYALDPSHPAFFVPGQEFLSTSHFRAFAALDRCRPDGDPCATGIDCCAGACNELGTCGPPAADSCAKLQERCSPARGCCNTGDHCINGFCSFIEPE